MSTTDRDSKLTGVFILAFLLFNFPIIGILGNEQYLIGHIPALYIYVFVAWLVIILLTYNLLKDKM